MEKKTIYQLSLASLLIIIITIIYLIYFNEKEISSIKEAVLNNREIEEGNLIEHFGSKTKPLDEELVSLIEK